MSKITTPKHPFLTQYSTNKSCRENAIDQLERFLSDPVLSYTSTRNHDFGRNQRYNTSCLSIWIDKRVLLEEEVITATLKHNKYKDVEKFIHEVFWRTYFKGWLEHRPQVWADYIGSNIAKFLHMWKRVVSLKLMKKISRWPHLSGYCWQ